jgi:hypothetical protein
MRRAEVRDGFEVLHRLGQFLGQELAGVRPVLAPPPSVPAARPGA